MSILISRGSMARLHCDHCHVESRPFDTSTEARKWGRDARWFLSEHGNDELCPDCWQSELGNTCSQEKNR